MADTLNDECVHCKRLRAILDGMIAPAFREMTDAELLELKPVTVYYTNVKASTWDMVVAERRKRGLVE